MLGDGVEGAVAGIVEWSGDVVGNVFGEVFGAFEMLGEGVYVPVYGGVCAVGGLLLLFGEFGTRFGLGCFSGLASVLESEEGRCPFRTAPGLLGAEEGGGQFGTTLTAPCGGF